MARSSGNADVRRTAGLVLEKAMEGEKPDIAKSMLAMKINGPTLMGYDAPDADDGLLDGSLLWH